MPLGDQVKAIFKAEYDAGSTYREIADRHGVSYTYVRGIILGIDSPGGISLAKLEKMFPKATLDLHGSSSSQVMHHVGDGNRQIMGGMDSDSLEAYQLRLYRGLATLPVPDDAKAKVLALIQEAAAG